MAEHTEESFLKWQDKIDGRINVIKAMVTELGEEQLPTKADTELLEAAVNSLEYMVSTLWAKCKEPAPARKVIMLGYAGRGRSLAMMDLAISIAQQSSKVRYDTPARWREFIAVIGPKEIEELQSNPPENMKEWYTNLTKRRRNEWYKSLR